ncbi:MAG: alpha/beta hydrolase [Cohaesibacter sp.]|jgi:esterase/lipase superfamily enzyme|nr:alpha/beta hydrolase [Cohaesibacter sp.]
MPISLAASDRFCQSPLAIKLLLALVLLCLVVSGCASRGSLGYSETSTDEAVSLQSVFVATNRQIDKEGTGLTFGPERAADVSYANYTISIPPNHKVGQIEWPSGKANPARHFTTVSSRSLPAPSAFRQSLSQAMASHMASPEAQKSGTKREVILYIHGYNTNFAEGLYRVAQIRNDYDMKNPMVLFSWPSAGKAGLYVYDRDSVIISRDALVEVIREISKADVGQITLAAHSLGSQLLMESLRQIHLSGQKQILAKVNGVILLSPDLDIDVFNTQLEQIDPLPKPFMIFASKKDEALEISGFLTGRDERVGNNLDLRKIKHSGVDVLDVSDFDGGDSLNHFTVATSPSLVNLLKGLRNTTTLQEWDENVKRDTIGSSVANTAAIPLRLLTRTTQAILPQSQ